MPAQLTPTCSRLGPDPAEPLSIPWRGARRHRGVGALLHTHTQPHTHSRAETTAQQRCWCSTHQGAGLCPCLAIPSPPLHSSAARGPSHTLRVQPQLLSTPGMLQAQNCSCPSTGWEMSTSCSLWPEGNRKHNHAMPSSDVIKTRLLPCPGTRCRASRLSAASSSDLSLASQNTSAAINSDNTVCQARAHRAAPATLSCAAASARGEERAQHPQPAAPGVGPILPSAPAPILLDLPSGSALSTL